MHTALKLGGRVEERGCNAESKNNRVLHQWIDRSPKEKDDLKSGLRFIINTGVYSFQIKQYNVTNEIKTFIDL